MSRLSELIAKANAGAGDTQKVQDSQTKQKAAPEYKSHKTKVESQVVSEENQFDELEDYIVGVNNNAVPPNFNSGLSKDGEKLEVGDPVVGIHQRQNMSGQVIGVQGDDITVEWKDRTQSTVKANTLVLSNVDDDYEEETMYIESVEPNMGFDKESFVEDTDLESLLKGRPDGLGSDTDFKYDVNSF